MPVFYYQKFKFIKQNTGDKIEKPYFIPDGSESFTTSDGKVYYFDQDYKDVNDKKIQFDAMTTIRKQVEIEKGLSSFWVPSLTPDAGVTEILKPSEETKCTEGNHALRLKQLIPVQFIKKDKESICPICSKTLSNVIKSALLKECGHVICQTCANNFIKLEKKCFVCNVPCRDKDIIKLEEGATGFSGHGAILEATKISPVAWV